MYSKTVFQLGLGCLLLLTFPPCISLADEGVVPTVKTIPIPGPVVVPAPPVAPPAGHKTIDTPLAEIPGSANKEWEAVCVDSTLNLNGDIHSIKTLGTGQWSVGPAVSTQLIKYDFGKKRAGVNTALGAGASFRFYRTIHIKDPLRGPPTDVYISQVKQECRQTSFGKSTKGYLAAPLFSITPTIYVSEPIDQDDLSVQPALLLGFFEDILNVGVGFNLTGPSGEKGNVFMLMSIGAGFNF